MDTSKLQNTMKKLSTIKGGSMLWIIGAVGAGLFFAIIGIGSMSEGSLGLGSWIFLVIGIVWIYFTIASVPKERKEIAASWAGLTPQEIQRIEEAAPGAPVIGSSFATPDALIMKKSQGPYVIPAKDILWIYGSETTHKAYGVITTGKTYSTIVVDRNGTRHTLNAKQGVSSEQLKDLFNTFKPNYPGMIFGYSQEVDALAQKANIARLAQYVDAENSKARA